VNEIAAIGHLSRDVVDGGEPRPGGTVFYAALTFDRLGADARIAASCAAEDRELLLRPLEALSLPVAWYESSASTAYRLRYEGDRRVLLQDSVGDPWTPEQAVEAVGDAHWVLVGGLVRTDFSIATLAALAGGGRALLVDAQGLVRTPALGRLRTDGDIGGALAHVSMLKLDDAEAEALLDTSEPDRLRELGVPEVLLTLGSRGSIVVTTALSAPVPATEVGTEIDPTGAGDTFAAAYLVSRSHGAEPVEAARAATDAVAAFLAER
jgi:sugar/nucleoside kinase (ribokinase family)